MNIISITIIIIDFAMRGLFRPLYEYTDLSILTVGVLCFVLFLGCMLEFSSKSARLPFAASDISIVMCILEFDYLD
jgi:hypothetical protein